MRTKKAVPRKKIPNPELYTTLRIIEREHPCAEEYLAFLHDLKSLPVDMIALENECEDLLGVEEDLKKLKRRKTTQFGPDDPISLSRVLHTKTSSVGYDGPDRLRWIVESGCAQSANGDLETLINQLSLHDAGGESDCVLLVLAVTDAAAVVKALEAAGHF